MRSSKDIQFELFIYIFHYNLRKNLRKYNNNEKIVEFLNTMINFTSTVAPERYLLFERRFVL
jgi:hypothetical protein